MPNALQTAQLITNDIVRIAHNSSCFLGRMNTDYEPMWKGKYAPGSTIYARRPVQASIRSGAAANIQDITESTVPVVVQPEIGIDFAISDYELATAVFQDGSINPAFRQRFLKPFGLRIATEVDLRIGTLIKNAVANHVGTPGTPPSTVADILNAKIPAQNEAVPPGEFYAGLSPEANAAVVSGFSALFNNQSNIGENYKTGMIKTGLGVDFVMSQNMPAHTVGPLGGTPLVAGASQGLINSGATDNPYAATTSLVTDGWTASAALRLNAGDVITIAGVFAVNPETKQSTGALRRFVVTANVSSDGSGNATLVIAPAIIAATVPGTTSAYQNVTARPADNAAITVVSGAAATAYSQNLLWHRDAITFVSPELELPNGMDMAAQSTMADSGGVSLRFVRGFDILNNRRISRFDVLWGAAVVQPGWVVRRTN